MPDREETTLQEKLSERLRFYEDLGLAPFYRDRGSSISRAETVQREGTGSNIAREISSEKTLLRKSPAIAAHLETVAPKTVAATPVVAQADVAERVEKVVLPAASGLPIFGSTGRIEGDTLHKTREDLGECTRCKLHKTRNKIVFGDGSSKAELVFVGEGPGADEDAQGLPFVGRAGKLLTQMIEAMGLQRKDVYICNVVKCRPPGNRQPEKDEVEQCSPFLFRQLDVLQPKVIVCLGATAAQTLLQTTRSISQFRGQWLDFRGYKMLATYHPAYLLRNPGAKGEVWKDLQKVMGVLGLEIKKKAK